MAFVRPSLMAIPEFDDNVLPEGVYDCTVKELEARFGQFQRSDRRLRLTERLKQYLDIAKRSGIVKGVIIDGSYVTDKDEPEDIDVIAVLTDEFDWTQELRPYQANVIDKAAIRRDYGFDAFVYQDGEAGLEKLIAVFGIVPEKYGELTAKTHKGMVRVLL